MKASRFEYIRAHDAEHALQLLARAGGEARLIAGGQSLVPMMAMRLATPELLIDINRLNAVAKLQFSKTAVITGATVTQSTLYGEPRLAKSQPLMACAMPWIGHEQTRNRGTVGGSLMQADPSAELPLLACMLNARMQIHRDGGQRTADAENFYTGALTTILEEHEMLTGIEWPVWPLADGESIGAAFDEVAIRHGDFAIASAACQVVMNSDGVVARAVMGVGGVAATPLALPALASQLIGESLTDDLLASAADQTTKAVDPGSDIHASAQYRRHLAGLLMRRVISAAIAQAGGDHE